MSVISGITPLWEEMPSLMPQSPAGTKTAEAVNPFTDIFRSAIDAVKETEAEKTQMEYLMSTGQLDNPVLLNIAVSKAELSVDLLLQLRSRAMEAYNELMRISL